MSTVRYQAPAGKQLGPPGVLKISKSMGTHLHRSSSCPNFQRLLGLSPRLFGPTSGGPFHGFHGFIHGLWKLVSSKGWLVSNGFPVPKKSPFAGQDQWGGALMAASLFMSRESSSQNSEFTDVTDTQPSCQFSANSRDIIPPSLVVIWNVETIALHSLVTSVVVTRRGRAFSIFKGEKSEVPL